MSLLQTESPGADTGSYFKWGTRAGIERLGHDDPACLGQSGKPGLSRASESGRTRMPEGKRILRLAFKRLEQEVPDAWAECGDGCATPPRAWFAFRPAYPSSWAGCSSFRPASAFGCCRFVS